MDAQEKEKKIKLMRYWLFGLFAIVRQVLCKPAPLCVIDPIGGGHAIMSFGNSRLPSPVVPVKNDEMPAFDVKRIVTARQFRHSQPFVLGDVFAPRRSLVEVLRLEVFVAATNPADVMVAHDQVGRAAR